MTCERCGGRLRVMHTYKVAPHGKTQDAVCEGCRLRVTMVTFVMAKVERRGDGAYAVAKKLRNGGLQLAQAGEEAS